MGNAIWLLLAVPKWYFATLASPFGASYFSAIPAFGALSLFVGLGLAFVFRSYKLLYFFLPFLFSEALLVFAGIFRGHVQDPNPINIPFLVAQFGILVYLVFRLKGARLPAVLLAIFSFTYALWAAFVAAMSFTDIWL